MKDGTEKTKSWRIAGIPVLSGERASWHIEKKQPKNKTYKNKNTKCILVPPLPESCKALRGMNEMNFLFTKTGHANTDYKVLHVLYSISVLDCGARLASSV